MFKSKFIAAAALALGAAAIAPTAALAQVDFSLVIGNAPPPPRFESVPPPRHGYVWAPGFWRWDGYRHAWVAGHWLQERPGYRYAPSEWVRVNNGWGWREGDKAYGWGIACAYKNTGLGGGAPDKSAAEVEAFDDGTVEVRTSSADMG